MISLATVKKFDVLEKIRIDFVEITIPSSIDPFLFQLREKVRYTGVVVCTSAYRHTASHVIRGKASLVARTGIVTSAVIVKDRFFSV